MNIYRVYYTLIFSFVFVLAQGCEFFGPREEKKETSIRVTITNPSNTDVLSMGVAWGDYATQEVDDIKYVFYPVTFPYSFTIHDARKSQTTFISAGASGSQGSQQATQMLDTSDGGSFSVTLVLSEIEDNYSDWTGPTSLQGGVDTANAVTLSNLKHWYTGSLPNLNDVTWYKMTVVADTEYEVSWDDAYLGTDTYTGDIKVTVYDADGTTPLVYETDSGYHMPAVFTAAQNTVYIKVEAYFEAGSYALGVAESSSGMAGSVASGLVTPTTPSVPRGSPRQ